MRFARTVCLIILSYVFTFSAYAQNFTFIGTDSNVWTTDTNWLGGAAPSADLAGDALNVQSGNGTTPFTLTNVDLTYTNIGGLTFTTAGTDGDYTLNGAGSFSFQDGASITNNKTGITTINVPIIGAGGTLNINAANGGIVLGGNITTPSSTIQISGANQIEFTGVIAGSGGLTINSTDVVMFGRQVALQVM